MTLGGLKTDVTVRLRRKKDV